MHQYMNLCLPYIPCLVHPLCIVWWKDWHPCMAVCLCLSHLISGPRPSLECVHASVHKFMSTWLLMSGPPPLHSLMETWCPCMAVCSCLSHLISVATPCLECVHASVHEFMSTWLLMFGLPHMDSYMESWVPLCVTGCSVPVTLVLFLHVV